MGNCYKKNFINKVIAKIDFLEPVTVFTPDTIDEAIAEIKKRFPIAEQSKAIQREIKVSKDDVEHTESSFMEWVFHGKERDKVLKVNKLFIEILLTKYKTEEDFKNDLILPISHLLKISPKIGIKRTGIRFINIFDFEINSFQDASLYFSKSITGHFSKIQNTEKCTRAMTINEFIYDDIKLRIQAGFFNPDYPAVIRRNYFVIDLDAYIAMPHLINDTEEYFKKLHDIIEENFENSITDKLRNEVLNG